MFGIATESQPSSRLPVISTSRILTVVKRLALSQSTHPLVRQAHALHFQVKEIRKPREMFHRLVGDRFVPDEDPLQKPVSMNIGKCIVADLRLPQPKVRQVAAPAGSVNLIGGDFRTAEIKRPDKAIVLIDVCRKHDRVRIPVAALMFFRQLTGLLDERPFAEVDGIVTRRRIEVVSRFESDSQIAVVFSETTRPSDPESCV